MQNLYQDVLLSHGNEDLVWEFFHENSKRSRYDDALPKEEVLRNMDQFHECLPYTGYPKVELPSPLTSLTVSLDTALASRRSQYDISADSLPMKEVSTLLHYAYGVTKDNKNTGSPRSLRVVPSAGALFPLEIYFYSSLIEGLNPGLYHYNPAQNLLRLLRVCEGATEISKALIQPEIASRASLIIFITGVFERTVFKYGDRGYRFVMLEAGHVAQNINLVSAALHLGSLNLGGYFDREIDHFLDLDGITHSTIYMIAIGKKSPKSPNVIED